MSEKLFSQDDVNAIVCGRLAEDRQRRGFIPHTTRKFDSRRFNQLSKSLLAYANDRAAHRSALAELESKCLRTIRGFIRYTVTRSDGTSGRVSCLAALNKAIEYPDASVHVEIPATATRDDHGVLPEVLKWLVNGDATKRGRRQTWPPMVLSYFNWDIFQIARDSHRSILAHIKRRYRKS